MSESKDKRIKKLKKNRIWPFILGMFVIVLIFACMVLALVGASVEDVVKRKVLNGLRQAEQIAESFKDYDSEDKNTEETILKSEKPQLIYSKKAEKKNKHIISLAPTTKQ